LEKVGIEILGHTVDVHGIKSGEVSLADIRDNPEKNSVRCADLKVAEKMKEEILEVKKDGDSVGGIIELLALNVPAGIGEPVFDKLDGDIAKAIMSIGAVKCVEIGAGFGVSNKKGSENNDQFGLENGRVVTDTNNSGGILGGISNGMPIVVRVAVKPTSSIAKGQKTVDLEKMKETTIAIKGRHDPCIVPRVLPVCESMLAIVLADHALRQGIINPSRI
ncbi:MAG: chorismate synthase, partial [Candidatus Hydrothermarchaeales archaeon]